MIRYIDNFCYLRQLRFNGFLDALTQGHVGSAATLAASTQAQVYRCAFDIDKLNAAAVSSNAGVNPCGQDLFDLLIKRFIRWRLRAPVIGDKRVAKFDHIPYYRANLFAQDLPGFSSRLGNGNHVTGNKNFADAIDIEERFQERRALSGFDIAAADCMIRRNRNTDNKLADIWIGFWRGCDFDGNI